MVNYRKLVNQIRKKSFPEIEGSIWIIKIPFPIPGGVYFWLLPNVTILGFSTACKKLNKKVITGIIAHELSHASIFQNLGYKKFWKYTFTATEKEGRKMERRTDKFTIEKGYGKELLAAQKKGEKLLRGTRWEKYLDNYLGSKEIQEKLTKTQ